ncbi:MAG: alpha-ribazole phosphatase [Leptospiraceae bacterium]|nr:alpha-ribazole phosphatase [Leptospiraceae bacterium]MDW7975634.1 alpha-ribazole phosphatase [Leptospiraceae bacterium]
MEIHIIRHTKTIKEKNRIYGRFDPPLADTFYQEAMQYKQILDQNYDKVFCSPLERCKRLAEFLGFRDVIYEPSLMEYSYGDWENKRWDEINPKELQHWMENYYHVAPPNGESFLGFHERVTNFINSLQKTPYDKVLLITHQGVIRSMIVLFENLPLEKFFEISIEHGKVYSYKI